MFDTAGPFEHCSIHEDDPSEPPTPEFYLKATGKCFSEPKVTAEECQQWAADNGYTWGGVIGESLIRPARCFLNQANRIVYNPYQGSAYDAYACEIGVARRAAVGLNKK